MRIVDSYGRPALSLGQAILIWHVALVVFLLFKGVAPLGVLILVYLIIGIVLSRVVLRGLVRWHWSVNHIGAITKNKLALICIWPIGYPVLFFQYFVANYL